MQEYSKYQAPEFAPIDWGKITEGIVEKLDKTEKEREAKRVALDKEYTDVVKTIDSFQGSKAPTFNQFIMSGANDIRDYLYQQNKLLKAGKIKPSEYSQIVATVSDGWGRLADVAKGYDKSFEESMKRIEEGKAGAQETYQRQLTSELMNLKNKRTFINPNDGRLYIAKLNEDGSISSDADLYDVQTLNAGLNQNVDKLILSDEVQKYTKNLGKEARMVNGRYVTSQEIRKDFESKAKPKIISSILSNPNKAASVLMDNTDEGYRLEVDKNYFSKTQSTIDELVKARDAEKDKNKKKEIQSQINKIDQELKKTILLDRDENNIYTPVLNEHQEKRAKEIVSDVIKSQLDYIVEKPETKSSSDVESGKGKEKEKSAKLRIEQVNDIYQNREGSKYVGLIKNAAVDKAFPGYEGYRVIELQRGENPNNKYIKVSRPLIDPKTKAVIGEDKKLLPMPSDKAEYQNIINVLLNQKYQTNFAWPEIMDEANQIEGTKVGLLD